MRLSFGVLAPILSALTHALMLVLLARGADPDEVAKILSLQVLIALLFTVVELGIGRELSVAVSRGPVEEYRLLNRIHVIGLLLITGLACSALLAVGAGLIPVLLTVYGAAERRISACVSASIASGRLVASSTALVSGRICGLGVFVALATQNSDSLSVQYAAVTAMSSALLAIVISFLPRASSTVSSRPRRLRAIISVSMHYWATTLMAQARTLDVAIVSAVVPLNAAAAYALPARALQPLRIVGTSMANVAFPIAVRGDSAQVSRLPRVSSAFSIAAILLLVLSTPILPALVVAVLGGDYRGAVMPLALFAAGAAINTPGSVLSAVLQAQGRQRAITILGAVLLVFQTVALPLAALVAGVNGAAWIVLSTYAIQLLVVSYLYKRRTAHE